MANLENYAAFYPAFNWQQIRASLAGLPGGAGFNIAHEAVDRHADSPLKNTVAIRWLKKNMTAQEATYLDLKKQSAQFANVLEKLGVQKGETVFSFAGRIPELYIAALGTLKKTAIFCPLFSVFGPEPVLQRLSKGNSKVLVTTSFLFKKTVEQIFERLPTLQFILLTDAAAHLSAKVLSLPQLMKTASDHFEIPPTDPETPALLHFTSGTTGMPKGALHVHQAVLTHFMTGKYVLDFRPGDVFWCTADPGWVTGTSYGIIAPLVNGVTNIVDEEEFDAARWYSILESQKVNIWYTAPTAIRRLMRVTDLRTREKYELPNLRLMLSVGEPLHAEGVVWCQKTFKIPVLDNWWQTETGGIMISNYPAMPVRPGSMGKPLPGVVAAIAEVTETDFKIIYEPEKQGNLVLKKGFPSMFRTYLNDEARYQKCFRGDWYITGDLARRDVDGYFWFVGRADDIIKTSGHMVGPFEVESTLMGHPSVAEAAVIGKPDPTIGELVKAFVVLKNGILPHEDLKLDIVGFARKKMGPAIAPKELVFVEALPKTRSGKILRRLLKARELGLPEGDLSTLEQS